MEESHKLSYAAQAIPLEDDFSCDIKHIPLKRIFDICFSLTVLVFAFPLFLFLAFVVRLSSKGNSVYSQERVGRGGKTFKCFKFRTMYPDAEERLKDILASDIELRKEWEHFHKLKSDPRVTSMGAFLRKTSLDELPQFWNVLKGDLSVVGPRPVVRAELEKHLTCKAEKILSIRPGLTGPWQVSGRSDMSYKRRIEIDEFYVDNQTFLWDLKLIVKTIPAMIFAKGAY